MDARDKFETLEVKSANELRDWLIKHYAQSESVWLVTWKKAVNAPYVSRDEVLDQLIAFGWIDGIRRQLDEKKTMQLISPRKQQAWAKSYKDRAERLEASCQMHEAGRAAIMFSKQSGLWNDTDEVDALIIPKDLQDALSANEVAWQFFGASAPSYRRNVLRWLHAAKRKETRAGRISKIVALSSQSVKVPNL